MQARFLQEVMKGWYVPARPDEQQGDSTAWYASFRESAGAYLEKRFEKNRSLSPEQSLLLHTDRWTVPHQLLVCAPKGGNKPTGLPHGTSIYDMRTSLPTAGQTDSIGSLRVFSLPSCLVHVGPGMFRAHAADVRTALAMIGDASEVLSILLEGGHSTVAGRLAGAFRNIGREELGDEIVKAVKAAGYTVNKTDPFEQPGTLLLSSRQASPCVTRMRLTWQEMRGPIIGSFPVQPEKKTDINAYMKNVDDVFVTDAYHSLSIEGYRVSEDPIRKVRDGDWDPDNSTEDSEHRNALAARVDH